METPESVTANVDTRIGDGLRTLLNNGTELTGTVVGNDYQITVTKGQNIGFYSDSVDEYIVRFSSSNDSKFEFADYGETVNNSFGIDRTYRKTQKGHYFIVTALDDGIISVPSEAKDSIEIKSVTSPALKHNTAKAGQSYELKLADNWNEEVEIKDNYNNHDWLEFSMYNSDGTVEDGWFGMNTYFIRTLSKESNHVREVITSIVEDDVDVIYPYQYDTTAVTFTESKTPALKHNTVEAGESYEIKLSDSWNNKVNNDKNVTFYGINKDGSELKQELSVTQTVKNSNNTINITANGTGGSGELTYKFIMYNADTKEWKKLQDFSKSNEYTGNINDYGELHFYTDVKDATGKVVRSEVSKLSIKDNNPLKINAAQKDNGNTVTFTANGTGGSGKYTYKFIVYNKTTNSWAKLQDFSDKNTFTWTKGNEGDRYFYVDVKDNSTGRVVRSEALNVKINKEDKPTSTLTASIAKVNVGSKVTLTAKATAGSGKYTYKFLIYNPTTKQWAKLQDFSDKSTFTWTAGSAGARQFYVDVKDSNGKVTRSKVVNVQVGNAQSVTKLSVKATASTTANKVGQNVTFTATGNGGAGGYTYKFIVYNKTTNQWAKLKDFSSTNKITWTAGSVGERQFYVDVKDKNGNVVRSSVMNVTTTK